MTRSRQALLVLAAVMVGLVLYASQADAARVTVKTLRTRVVVMERLMGGPLPHRAHGAGYWRWWHWRASRQFASPPHKSAWLCIHSYEGSWTDPNGPYYGGLQMDLSFQRAYGAHLLQRKGTADHWTPLEQMWVAERAHRAGRGFYPWPNSARYCGLI